MKYSSVNNRASARLLISALPWMVAGTIALVFIGVDALTILVVIVFFVLCIACLRDISSNVYFMCFLLSLFVFLISGDLAEQIFNKQYWLQFGEAANNHSRLCILISLAFLFLGFLFTKTQTKVRISLCGRKEKNVEYIETIKKASRLIFYLSYWMLLFDSINKVVFVASNGYVSYYSSYSSLLPTILIKLGDFTQVSLAIFLATFPSKRECTMPLLLYMLYALIIFLMGQRGGLVYNFIFVFGYMYYRNGHNNNGETWISKRMIFMLIACTPVILVLLQLYGYSRIGVDIKFESFKNSLVDFFVNVGSSSKVIKAGYVYQAEIPSGRFYSLGTILNYFKYSPMFNLFSSGNIPDPHTSTYALGGHSFGDLISYLYMRSNYLAGEGAGSSFIAELYADFGYIGIAAGSYIYGFMFKRFSNLDENHWLSTAAKILIFLYTIKAPRGSFDGFLACIINFKHIIAVIIIVFVANTIYRKKNYKIKKVVTREVKN